MEASEQMETITLNSSNMPQVMIQGANGELKMLSLADLKSLGVNLIEDLKSDDQIMGWSSVIFELNN